MIAIFRDSCPNCWGDIDDDRLREGLPCPNCLPRVPKKLELFSIVSNLKVEGDLTSFYEIERKVDKFSKLFKDKIGSEPWNLQLVWARRVFLKRSFAILAPTGIGKTTFGLMMSLFLEGKSYLVFPTNLLVKQAEERLNVYNTFGKRIVAYHSGMKQNKKKETKKNIENGEFDILITTTMFLYKNFQILKNNKFEMIFVDDVDSFLKSAKNIDKALMLLGFSERDIKLAFESIKLKSELAQGKDVLNKFEKVKEKLEVSKKSVSGILVVSSATAKPKSKKVKLFRELLNFEIGRTVSTLRNVDDYVVLDVNNVFERTFETIKFLGKGGLIFVPSDLGVEGAHKMKKFLVERGITAETYENVNDEILERFKDGEIQVLVGISSYRNPLARGLDLPQHIRYAVFSGVPKMVFSLKLEDNPKSLLSTLILLRNVLDDKADRLIARLRRYEYVIPGTPSFERAKPTLEAAKEYLEKFFSDKQFIEKINKQDDIAVKEIGGEIKIIVGDVAGYIQASGRTSRMYAGGITKGLSVLIVDDKKAYNRLKKQLSWFIDGFAFKKWSIEEVKKTVEQVDKSRDEIKEVLEGKAKKKVKEFVKSVGVIVESPNKARTIAGFFGKPLKRIINGFPTYEVNTGEYIINIMASQGHVFDLATDVGFHGVLSKEGKYIPVYDTIKKCNSCGHQFTTGKRCPKCGSENIMDKKEIIKALRELSKEVNTMFIASDPDTEGEKIAWDMTLMVRPFSSVSRIEFHEVTKTAFLNAIKNRRGLDENRVKAQITRRIADRWVGFELSGVLQKRYKNKNLSAGRVQSPVLTWVIERWMESKKKKWVTFVYLGERRIEFDGKIKPEDLEITKVEEKIIELPPKPPFTTDTLLREASHKLKFDSTKTMNIAQDLFELGFITYHRTDSTRVSNVGIKIAKDYISREYGERILKPRTWKTGSGEGAHECIRPTRAMDIAQLKQFLAIKNQTLSKDHLALYELIFRRFMESQMKNAKVKTTKYLFKLGEAKKEIETITEILEDGWNILSELDVWEPPTGKIKPNRIYSKLVPTTLPYTLGEIIARMKEEGIGRPSTYAKIIQTLLDRKYIINSKGRLIPTRKGIIINEYLQKNYPNLVSVEFTQKLEEVMNKIEQGYNYQKVLSELKKTIESVQK